ncbi:hypothetical protein [Vibrio sp. 99-8-1]|nr:hypothetical protein [Vibrio sp. 99-8-1]
MKFVIVIIKYSIALGGLALGSMFVSYLPALVYQLSIELGLF